jgi:uncharacterized membrane protein YidH (DUF202 family)
MTSSESIFLTVMIGCGVGIWMIYTCVVAWQRGEIRIKGGLVRKSESKVWFYLYYAIYLSFTLLLFPIIIYLILNSK